MLAAVSAIGATTHNLKKIADESKRVAYVAHNAPFRTLGHDPIMGWIFGPVNILSDTLTKSDIITSYNVRNMIITDPIPTTAAFSKAFQAIQSDKMNLPTESFNDMISGEGYNF